MERPVLILGAGPAGMAAAMELTRHGVASLIVEKEDGVGGLARTLEFREPEGTYRTDIGPHRFFTKNKELHGFVDDALDGDWVKVPRFTRFFIDDRFYLYPVRGRDVLRNIRMTKGMRILFDYAWERLRGIVYPRRMNSFYDWVVSRFGYTLAAFNMLNYTEKIWGIPSREISADWAKQRIAGLSFLSALAKAFFKTKGPKTLVDEFFYPPKGSGFIYEKIREKIEAKGSRVLLSTEPLSLQWEGNRLLSIVLRRKDGTQESVSADYTISSIPITRLLTLFQPAPPREVLDALGKLRFRSQVYLFLMIDRERLTKDNWVYFPDAKIPFGRVSEMKNFSEEMSPKGKTSLFVEFFCFEGDRVWNASKEGLLSLALPWLEKLGFLKSSEVLHAHVLRKAHVYPIYDLSYKDYLETVLRWLDRFENFQTIGRPGRFRYTNQDHSILMGLTSARGYLRGERADIDGAIRDDEYFEKGEAPREKTGIRD